MKKLLVLITLFVTPLTFGEIIKNTRTYVGKKNVTQVNNSRINYNATQYRARTNRNINNRVIIGYNRGIPIYSYTARNNRNVQCVRPTVRGRF